MISFGYVCGVVALMNFIVVRGTVVTPMKMESPSLQLYKASLNNEFDYVLKRTPSQTVDESPDSKERRSQIGSSFIRFGRSHHQGNLENPDYALNNVNDLEAASSRIPRGRSDVIIRFGRAGLQKVDFLPSKVSKNFVLPLNIQKLALICSDILAADVSVSNDLYQLCSSLISGSTDSKKNY